MKKLLLLSLTMLLPVLIHADGIEINGIYYNLVSKLKQAEVTSNPNYYTGSVDIPSTVTYEGVTYDVIKIGYRAFHSCENLTSVSIPNSVTSIEEGAFSYCSNLSSLTIPNSVTVLGKKAISQCRKIASLTIGTGLTEIKDRAFEGSTGFEKVIIKDIAKWCEISFGDNPLEWGNGRLYSNENTEITELVIPYGVKSINSTAFRGCKYLTSVTIPNTVDNINNGAFSGCIGLTKIEIPNSVKYLSGFDNCTGLSSITIPSSVNTIGNSAFYNCTGLTSVEIPESVTTIKDGAFGLTNIKTIVIPNSVKTIENIAFCDCSKLTSVTIGSGVTTIGDIAFSKCQELTDVYCYAEEVPQTSSNAFENSLIEYATLHAPENSMSAYKSTVPWNGFGKFDNLSSSGVTQIQSNGVLVESNGGQLSVEGVDNGKTIDVYSVNGTKIGSAISRNGTCRIDTNLKPSNIGIVKIENKSIKVIVK